MSDSSGADRLREIDALRITAAVAVVLYHYTFAHTAFGGLSSVTRFGYLGVDLFFLISGFVSLLTAFDRSPRRFAVSRAVRLYPAFWTAVTLTTAGSMLLGSPDRITPVRYLANLTMLNALADRPNIDVVYWTLWAELRFYALILLLTVVGTTRRRVTAALWGWLALTVVLGLGLLPGALAGPLTLVFQPAWAQYFIAGMAMCLLYRFGPSRQVTAILLVAYAIAVPRALRFAGHVAARYHTQLRPAVVVALVTAVFAVMLLVALGGTRRLGRPWFTVLGALTYPLYLVHDRLGTLLFDRLDGRVNRWVLLPVLVASMAGLAWAIHVAVERPLGSWLKRRLSAAPQARHRAPAQRRPMAHAFAGVAAGASARSRGLRPNWQTGVARRR